MRQQQQKRGKASLEMSAPATDRFGRPIILSDGDREMDRDAQDMVAFKAKADKGGWGMPYGGTRSAGEMKRGGYVHNPVTLWFLPGLFAGFFLNRFMNPSKGKKLGGGKKAPAGKGKVASSWAGPVPPAGVELKMMLVVREDLGMSIGKTGAQCAHAAVGLVQKLLGHPLLRQWEAFGQAKITLKCKDLDEMIEIAKKAEAAGQPIYVVHDAGRTEIAAGSATVLAIGPGSKERIDPVTGHLKLLR